MPKVYFQIFNIYFQILNIYLPIAAGMTIRHTIKSRIASPTIATWGTWKQKAYLKNRREKGWAT